jgi:hypothetical protein
VTFYILVVNAGSGTLSPSGVLLDPNDLTATVGTPLDGGGGVWTIPVTYPAAAVSGSRTVTPTVQLQDSLNSRSTVVPFPALTIKTVSGVNDPPVITMIATPSIVAGTNATWQGVPVAFTATATDPNGDALTYSWSFGDGGKGDLAGSPDAAALVQSHTFAAGGVYPVIFTADDGRVGGKKSISLNLNILPNAPPAIVVVQNPAGNPYANAPINFVATVTDPNADIVKLTWDFGDTTTGLGANVTHTFLASGITTVTLTADDGKGGVKTWSTTFTVQANRAPVSAVTTPPTNLFQKKAYTFNATATDPDVADTISQYLWDFGDGTPVVTSATATQAHTFAGTFAGTAQVKVRAVDNHGGMGDFSPAVTFTVVATPLPVVTFVTPSTATTLNADLNGPVTQAFIVSSTNPQASLPGAVDPIPAANLAFVANDPLAAVTNTVSNGGGSYTVTVQYTGSAAVGTRTTTPTLSVTDSLGIQSLTVSGPAMTIKTQGANHPPVITVTAPTSASNAAFTQAPVDLAFTLTDPDGDVVAYTVDWKDGTTLSSGTAASGTEVKVSHAFPDSFSGTAAVVIAATDNHATNAIAAPKVVTFVVTFNAYPTATINSPQASGITPAAVAALGIPATDPAVVILPINGKVAFAGTVTPPSQGTATSYLWTFEGGVPSSSANLAPGEITFQGSQGEVTAHRVTFTVIDSYGRSSKDDPTQTSPLATKQSFQRSYQRWVVVDGNDSQNLTLSFLYRKRSGTSDPDSYALAQNAAHGYGATVGIFQDGINNTYTVAGANGATTQIPVRSDVPFWLSLPSTIGGDTIDTSSYMFSIPNLPNLDPDLERPGLPRMLTLNEGTAFAFQNSTYPWNPQLQIATGGGFGTEVMAAGQRRFMGNTELFNNVCGATGVNVFEPNLRWLDRLSVPLTDALPVLQWPQAANNIGGFSGLQGYQSIPEWFVFIKAMEVRDWNTRVATSNTSSFSTAGTPADMGFIVDDKYNSLTQSSQHLAVSALQAFRAPASASDPYKFDDMKANLTNQGSTGRLDGNMDATTGLNPTPMGPNALAFMSGLMSSDPSGKLAGGLYTVHVPYNVLSNDRIPNTPQTYHPNTNLSNFSYAEYLWTKVWARPLVINRTNLNYADTWNFLTYFSNAAAPDECTNTGHTSAIDLPWFFYSNPVTPIVTTPATATPHYWPFAANVSPTNSSYDLNVVNGGAFDASSPVTETTLAGTTMGTSTGVGRFFWTAFTPHYDSALGALISRTWLADGVINPNQIPTSFPAATNTDATTAWGFLPPQSTLVDKRTRDRVTGLPVVPEDLGGYRVTWFNPTVDSNGAPVSPDFWAVQVKNGTTTQVFLLSGSYPRAAQSQNMSSPLVTDAREFIPSRQATYQPGDLAGSGSCWFDIPPELRPAVGTSAQITIFALKSILQNHAVPGARILNRSEWVEAVKTVTASISTVPGGQNVSFAHKIPFNYPWDIVVVNGPATPVAP